jgi:hypothetical protein
MKTLSALITVALASTVALSLDFSSMAQEALKAATQTTQAVSTTTTTPKSSITNLSDKTVTSGLKEALKIGVDFGVKALSQKDGYLSNANVKIPLPGKLAKAETLIKKAWWR